MQDENDHVQWMRRTAGNYRKVAETETSPKKREAQEAFAERMMRAAGAMEAALSGSDPSAFGGHGGLMRRLRTGTAVMVSLMTGEVWKGTITAMGRYDFALQLTDAPELVIAKHAVAYWVLEPEPVEGEGEEVRGVRLG